jgi:hypothetical protein
MYGEIGGEEKIKELRLQVKDAREFQGDIHCMTFCDMASNCPATGYGGRFHSANDLTGVLRPSRGPVGRVRSGNTQDGRSLTGNGN